MIGLDGIAVLNSVANADEATIHGNKKLRTLITHNDGLSSAGLAMCFSALTFLVFLSVSRRLLEAADASSQGLARTVLSLQVYCKSTLAGRSLRCSSLIPPFYSPAP